MKTSVFLLLCFVSLIGFTQEEEFIPVTIEAKQAFMSTKTGEYIYKLHAETDATQLKTTSEGVVYTAISNYKIKKGETLTNIAKKNAVSVKNIQQHNKITKANLKPGKYLKIVKQEFVKSSSPVITYTGEARVIAKLRPGETPGQFAPPPPIETVEKQLIETKKTEEQSSIRKYKINKNNIKNPILGINTASKKESKKAKKLKLKKLQEKIKRLEAEIEEKPKQKENTVIKSKAKKTINNNNKVEDKHRAKNAAKLIAQVKKTNKIYTSKNKTIELEKEIEIKKKALIDTTRNEQQKADKIKFHEVRLGETFYRIAKKYKTTVKTLMTLNNKKSTHLTVGQKLKIPNK